jgi:hypothetical protein
MRLRKDEREAGEYLLTARRSLGGRENDGEVDGGEDRRRGRASRAATASSIGCKRTGEGGGGSSGVSEGGCGEALGALI